MLRLLRYVALPAGRCAPGDADGGADGEVIGVCARVRVWALAHARCVFPSVPLSAVQMWAG